MTTQTDSGDNVVVQLLASVGTDKQKRGALSAELKEIIEARVEDITKSIALLRCIADSLHLGLDDNPSTVHACTSLDIAILRISEARDGLEFVELSRAAKLA